MRSFNDTNDFFGSRGMGPGDAEHQPGGQGDARRGRRAGWGRRPGATAMGRGGRPGGFGPAGFGPGDGPEGFGAPGANGPQFAGPGFEADERDDQQFGGRDLGSRGFGDQDFGDRDFGDRDFRDQARGGHDGRGFGGHRGPQGPGFGPQGPGFGPQGPGFGPGFGFGGPMGRGGHGPGGRGPGRGRKGDVRNAILALLAEKPMNGYQLISAISEKSEGLWSPSAGSVYPALNLLTDEGLIHEVQVDGKKASELTDAGREYVEQHTDELNAPWQRVAQPHKGFLDIRPEVGQLSMAVQQVVMQGDQGQIEAVRGILDRARKDIYRLLAGESTPDAGTRESSAGE